MAVKLVARASCQSQLREKSGGHLPFARRANKTQTPDTVMSSVWEVVKAATRGGGGDTEGAADIKLKHIVCQFNSFA